jgi:hypothetical protein
MLLETAGEQPGWMLDVYVEENVPCFLFFVPTDRAVSLLVFSFRLIDTKKNFRLLCSYSHYCKFSYYSVTVRQTKRNERIVRKNRKRKRDI